MSVSIGYKLPEIGRMPGQGEPSGSRGACEGCNRRVIHDHRLEMGRQWRAVSACIREGEWYCEGTLIRSRVTH